MDLDMLVSRAGDAVLLVVPATAAIYVVLIVLTRLVGLRSFSKMSSFDFATTVAMGSIIAAAVVAQDPPVVEGILALFTIFALQYVSASLRRNTTLGSRLLDNEPLLLMDGEEFLEENMDQARITDEDIFAKLREANVHDLSEVRAVVLETTGDVSVLHTDDDTRTLDPKILSGVRGRDNFSEGPQPRAAE